MAIQQEALLSGLVEPGDEIDQGGFTRSGGADDGDRCACGDVQGDLLEDLRRPSE